MLSPASQVLLPPASRALLRRFAGYLLGVFTEITFENAELPDPLNALTRYRYQVLLFSPEFANVVTLAPTEPTCAKFEQLFPVQRSMLKPVSLLELSVHDR